MSTRIQIRRGNNLPIAGDTGLVEYELGYNTATNNLMINNGGIVKILDAEDAQTLDGVNSTSFVRNNDGDQTIDGNLTLTGELIATAQTARYADIAEYYETNGTYEAGDVMMLGVEHESVLADGSMPIMGVCSTKPAYLMNSDIEASHFAPIALKGRIPVKITGDAQRGQFIVLGEDGKGEAVDTLEGIDRERAYIGVCVTASADGEETCEVKV